jgi:hypothetical protein
VFKYLFLEHAGVNFLYLVFFLADMRKNKSRSNRLASGTGKEKMFFAMIVLIVLALIILSCQSGIIPRVPGRNASVDLNLSKKAVEQDIPGVDSVCPGNSTNSSCIVQRPKEVSAHGSNLSQSNLTNRTVGGDKGALDAPVANKTDKPRDYTPARSSVVEFYLLVKDRAYIQHLLPEEKVGYYNFTGRVMTVQPLIITSSSVLFKVDDYTTKALSEGQSDSHGDFEIIVSHIYYRR